MLQEFFFFSAFFNDQTVFAQICFPYTSDIKIRANFFSRLKSQFNQNLIKSNGDGQKWVSHKMSA